MRSITSPKTWLNCTNKPASLCAAFALVALSYGAAFFVKTAPAQAQQKAPAPQKTLSRTLNCRDLEIAQAIFRQRRSGGSGEYETNLRKFYDEFPANCWLRAHVENELADYYQGLLNLENAEVWDQRLAFTLSRCQTSQCGTPGVEVDGYTCLKQSLERSAGAAQSDHCRLGVEWDYVEKYRNQSSEQIKRSLAERAEERERILAGDFLHPFDAQILAKLAGQIETLKQNLRSLHAPTKLEAAHKLAYANYYKKKWADAAYLAAYCLKETNDNGSLPQKLDARQRVALLYLLYRALWRSDEYAEAMKAIDYCLEGLKAFRDTIRDEQKKVEYFQNLETVLSDKVYLLLDRREILNALIWLDEGKAPILDEIITGKTKAKVSRSQTQLEPDARRETQPMYLSAVRGVQNKKPAQEENATKTEKPVREENAPKVEDQPDKKLFGDEIRRLEDKSASKPEGDGLKAGEIAITYFIHQGENEKSRLFTIVYIGDQMPFALEREMAKDAIQDLVDGFGECVRAYNGNQDDREERDKAERGVRNKKPAQAGNATNAEQKAQAILEEMYDGLMRPVVDALTKRSIKLREQKLIIIPFGETANFPFHAMFDAKDGKYLFERFKGVAYTPSLSIYLRGRENPIAGCDGLLGLALTKFENVDPLGYTIQEVEEVKKLFQRPRLLRNHEATKERLLKEYTSYPVLHFATHAEFNREHPQESKIRLYGDGVERNNLSAADLIDLNFQLAGKLVVLSACETGVQQPKPGDDYLGIERYLLAARASAIVSSLWQVDDLATMEFMKEFYREFTNGCIDPSIAWRTAMARAKEKRPKNLFAWAPFKVTGY